MSTLAEVWADLEERLPADRAGRMVKRILPDSAMDLHVSASRSTPRRALHLDVSAEAVAGADIPGSTRGITMTIDTRATEGKTTLALELTDPADVDLFESVCENIAGATAAAPDDQGAVSVWIGRFLRWQRFLQRGGGPLSARRQRGLYAELWTIRELLIDEVGPAEAVAAWTGPENAPRDFETAGVGIEIKSSAANEPQVVPVNGERQLDDAELRALFVVHLSLEPVRDAGETLPAIVADLRRIVDDTPAEGPLEDRLLAAGYNDMHQGTYAHTGYALRRLTALRVVEGFPRITERDLPDGVGSVHYSLAIDGCRDHEVPMAAIVEAIGS